MIGIIPCAGSQTRMKELTFAKELLPLFDGRPVVQHSIDCLRRATTDIVAVVNPVKTDLIRYFRSQSVYVIPYAGSSGPIDTLQHGALRVNSDFLFCLSDTYYQPENIFVSLKKTPQPNVLGLFKSATPERFDSVKTKVHSPGGSRQQSPNGGNPKIPISLITTYASKIDPPLSPWTMGCGKLSLEVVRNISQKSSEQIFEDLFVPLIKQRSLYGLKTKSSVYYDLGTPAHYIEFLITHHKGI